MVDFRSLAVPPLKYTFGERVTFEAMTFVSALHSPPGLSLTKTLSFSVIIIGNL